MYNLSIHIKPNSSKKNRASIVMVYYRDGEGGAFVRSLNHRGISLHFLAQRKCTEAEYNTESNPYRYSFLYYYDWDMLIRDERKYTEDPEWIEELEALKSQWPRFKVHIGQSYPIVLFPQAGDQLRLLFADL
jgi:hypothetical protein